jgi:hypothetical protein
VSERRLSQLPNVVVCSLKGILGEQRPRVAIEAPEALGGIADQFGRLKGGKRLPRVRQQARQGKCGEGCLDAIIAPHKSPPHGERGASARNRLRGSRPLSEGSSDTRYHSSQSSKLLCWQSFDAITIQEWDGRLDCISGLLVG